MPPPDGEFPTTDWTLISRLRSREDAVAQRALNDLCAQYHYPLYCYIRRRGLEHHDAQDALHDFLAKLLRNDSLRGTHQDEGRLRGFLSTALQRFLQNWHRDRARERDTVSAECAQELAEAEARFQRERLTDEDTPDRIFERKWALELLRHVQETLRIQYQNRGKEALYAALRPGLLNGGSLRGEDTPRIAASLAMSEGAVRVAMNRLLEDYRAILREEVRQTVERAEDVESELGHLIGIFQNHPS